MNIEDAIVLAGGAITNCLLCDDKQAAWMGIFLPDDASRFVGGNLARGKTRAIAYRLCGKCARQPDATERAEEKMILH